MLPGSVSYATAVPNPLADDLLTVPPTVCASLRGGTSTVPSGHRVASLYAWSRPRPAYGHQHGMRSQWESTNGGISLPWMPSASRTVFVGVLPRKLRRSIQTPQRFRRLLGILSIRYRPGRPIERRYATGAFVSALVHHGCITICLGNIVNPGPSHPRALAAPEVLRLGTESITPCPIKVRSSLAYTTVVSRISYIGRLTCQGSSESFYEPPPTYTDSIQSFIQSLCGVEVSG